MEKTFQTGLANLQAAGQHKFVQTRGAAGRTSRVTGRQTGDKVAGVEKGTPSSSHHAATYPQQGQLISTGWPLPAAWTQNLQIPSRSNELHQLTKSRGNVGKLWSAMTILVQLVSCRQSHRSGIKKPRLIAIRKEAVDAFAKHLVYLFSQQLRHHVYSARCVPTNLFIVT